MDHHFKVFWGYQVSKLQWKMTIKVKNFVQPFVLPLPLDVFSVTKKCCPTLTTEQLTEPYIHTGLEIKTKNSLRNESHSNGFWAEQGNLITFLLHFCDFFSLKGHFSGKVKKI